MMTYEECLTYIHSRPRFSERRTDLSKEHRLLERLGNPHLKGRFVHVTGTNGKGSVCAYVSTVLREAGYRTGLFTSPYLVRFEERFQVDGQNISPEDLTAIVNSVRAEEDELEAEGYAGATEFEVVTAVGFCYFASQNCDYVVLEVGIGGRLDNTNVIAPPACACITAVSFDHMKTLGNTLEAIATEKSGIIKPGSQAVVSPDQTPEVLAVIRRACEACGAKYIAAGDQTLEISSETRDGTDVVVDGVALHIPLLGRHQVNNGVTAFAVCRALGLPDEIIQRGIAKTVWPARLQYIPGMPPMLLDAGHNPAGVETLCRTLDRLFPDTPLRIVMGMMSDKATDVCIPAMARRAKHLYACAVNWPRAMNPEELAKVAGQYCETTVCASVEAALQTAKAEAQPGELVLVCGSVYLVGDVLGILERG